MEKMPAIFRRKVVVDRAIQHLLKQPLVDLDDYRDLKKEQRITFKACESVYYPSKKEEK